MYFFFGSNVAHLGKLISGQGCRPTWKIWNLKVDLEKSLNLIINENS